MVVHDACAEGMYPAEFDSTSRSHILRPLIMKLMNELRGSESLSGFKDHINNELTKKQLAPIY